MRLPRLHTDLHRGIGNFAEARPYHITYILRDYQGNQARYNFTVIGTPDARVTPRPEPIQLDDYRLFNQCLWPLHTRRNRN